MTDYIINYTDPLKGSFIIKPYTSNGPRFPTTDKRPSTSAVVSSPLLLYGKGHPNYGERTDENLLHLAENFSGPSAPIIDSAGNTIPGIIWHAEVLYFHDTVGSDWYQWNGSGWVTITVTESGTQPASPFNGDFWYDTSNLVLHRYSNDERGIESWIPVEFETGGADPNIGSPIGPTRELRVNHDGTSWTVVPDLTVVNELIDSLMGTYVNVTGDTMTGSLTISTTSPQLTLTDGTSWNLSASSTFNLSSSGVGISIDPSGVVSLIGYATGSPNQYKNDLSGDNDIPNKAYVDGLVSGAISTDTYVTSGTFSSGVLTLNRSSLPSFDITSFTADQITFGAGSPLPVGSPLTINIGPVATTEVQTALNELETQKAALAGASFTGTVNFNSTVTGNNPSAPTELATKDYVDSTIVTAGPYERYIITGTTDTILLPDFPNFSYTSDEYRLMVFKNGVKLYAPDISGSPIVEYGYREILVTPVLVGSPPGFSPRTYGPGSPIVTVDQTGTSSVANGIELTTPPLITDVFEFILT